MLWRTHLIGGIASLGIIYPLLEPESLGLLASVAALGTLTPDLDSVRAKIHSVGKVRGISVFEALSVIVRSMEQHRGPLHSLLGACFLGALFVPPLAVFLGWAAGLAWALGYLSHLLLDCLTVSGIRLLWPNPTSYYLLPRRLRVTTGSALEDVVLAPLAVAALLLLISAFGAFTQSADFYGGGA